MKTHTPFLLLAGWLLLQAGCVTVSAGIGPLTAGMGPDAPYVRHIVLWKYQADTAPSERLLVEQEFAELADSIEAVAHFEMGRELGAAPRSQGYEMGVLMLFEDEAALAEYIEHPAHKAFVELFRRHAEDIFVFDYVPEG